MKKKFGFVQVNFQQGPKEFNNWHLPYSAGILIAYALSVPKIKQEWEMGALIWRRDPVETTAQKLKDFDLVAFSTYVWNREYNYTLAQRIKELNPNCIIDFGGPEPPVQDPNIFKRYPWMDVVGKNEGEFSFAAILERFDQGLESLIDVPGLLINLNGEAVDTGTADRIDNLDAIPSPYLTGVFDSIVAENPDVNWSATLETNRGCPYACTFCDYGADIYDKIKVFDVNRILAEIDWIGRNCDYITVADANFGILVERDSIFMDAIVDAQLKYNKLHNMGITWAKNKTPDILNIVKKFIQLTPTSGQGLTMSVQSMDENVLDIIKRRNLEQHKFKAMFDWCEQHNVPAYSEIILGLPGETANSWKENFWKMLEAGNHTGINVHQCQLLENAEMNLLQRKLYKIETRPIYDYVSGTYERGEVEEYAELVVSTSTLPANEMMEIWIWNSLMFTFHVHGITSYISRFLNKKQGVTYQQFYDQLFAFINNDPWWRNEIETIKQSHQDWINNGRVKNNTIAGVVIPGWMLTYRTTINLHASNRFDQVFDLLKDFLTTYYPSDMNAELIRFQRHSVVYHDQLKSYPTVVNFDYDFFGYVNYDDNLYENTAYKFSTLEDTDMTFKVFLENFYFARKRNHGKTTIAKYQKRLSPSKQILTTKQVL
jgi:putative methyltransferase